jgi:CRP-like cAMP-binding protein
MSHTVNKIPMPEGWLDIIPKIAVGRPSPKHMTVYEFAQATGTCRKTASDTLAHMVEEGKLTMTKSLFNGRKINFYAPKK